MGAEPASPNRQWGALGVGVGSLLLSKGGHNIDKAPVVLDATLGAAGLLLLLLLLVHLDERRPRYCERQTHMALIHTVHTGNVSLPSVSALWPFQHEPENRELYLKKANRCYLGSIRDLHKYTHFFPASRKCWRQRTHGEAQTTCIVCDNSSSWDHTLISYAVWWMYWPPSSLPATSKVHSSETPQEAREASSSSGHPASSRTCSSTRRPSKVWTWAWDTPRKNYDVSPTQTHVDPDSRRVTLISPTVSCPVTSRVWVFWARTKSCILMLVEKRSNYCWSRPVCPVTWRLKLAKPLQRTHVWELVTLTGKYTDTVRPKADPTDLNSHRPGRNRPNGFKVTSNRTKQTQQTERVVSLCSS